MDDNRVRRIRLSGNYLGENLAAHMHEWHPSSGVLIVAPTGSGKNTFVMQTLRPSLRFNEYMLLITNRIALDRQQKYIALEEYGIDPVQAKETTLDGMVQIGNLFLCTYHTLVGILPRLERGELEGVLPCFKYVIMDEAHFFVADSLFNPSTEYLLNHLVWYFQTSIRIYMTATPDEIIKPIIYYENQRFNCNAPDIFHQMVTFEKPYQGLRPPLILYELSRSPQNDKISFFYDMKKEIAPRIEKDASKSKWLVFVSSKNEGKDLYGYLGGKSISVSYLDAEKKKNKSWQRIVENHTFDTDVLICTSVFDNGISLSDPRLKHIVVSSFDKVELLQMIGRKRRKAGESIDLYFQIMTKRDLIKQKNRNKKLLDEIYSYQKSKDGPGAFLQRYWNHWGNPSYYAAKFFYMKRIPDLKEAGQLVLNNIATYKLQLQATFYEQFDESTVEVQYQNLVCNWLGVSKQASGKVIGKDLSDLQRFIDKNLNSKIGLGPGQTEFKNILFKLLKREIETLRGDEAHRKSAINRGLKVLGLPYQLQKEQNCLVLRQKK